MPMDDQTLLTVLVSALLMQCLALHYIYRKSGSDPGVWHWFLGAMALLCGTAMVEASAFFWGTKASNMPSLYDGFRVLGHTALTAGWVSIWYGTRLIFNKSIAHFPSLVLLAVIAFSLYISLYILDFSTDVALRWYSALTALITSLIAAEFLSDRFMTRPVPLLAFLGFLSTSVLWGLRAFLQTTGDWQSAFTSYYYYHSIIASMGVTYCMILLIDQNILSKEKSGGLLDPVSHLLSESAFQRATKPMLAYTSRHSKPMSLALIRLDRLPLLSHHFGKDLSNQLLCRFADTALDTLRDEDIMGIHKDDTLIALLPGTTKEQAIDAMERLQRNWENVQDTSIDSERHTSFSAGISFGNGYKANMIEMIKNADAALMQAVVRGRDKIIAFEGPSENLADHLATSVSIEA